MENACDRINIICKNNNDKNHKSKQKVEEKTEGPKQLQMPQIQ